MGLLDRFRKKTASGASEPRWRARDFSAHSLGDGTQLIQLRGGAGAGVEILPDGVADVLRRCAAFHSAKQHADRIAADLGLDGAERDAIEREVNELAAAGLLWEHGELATALAKPGPRRPIERVTVLTCERPALLERCLTSIAQALERSGRSAEILVFDDAKSTGSSREARRVASQLAGTRWAGSEERGRYADLLTRETKLPAGAIEFALFGAEGFKRTTGANMNASALENPGRSWLNADDDTVWRFAPAPGREHGLALASGYDPTDLRVDRERTTPEIAAVDPLALHEEILGRAIANCLADSPDLDLDRADARFLRRASEGAVAATMAGVFGDSGMGSTGYYLTRTGAIRERLMEDWETLRTSRAVRRAAVKTTISDGWFYMSGCAGFDGTRLLPPSFPVLRNSDGIFAAVLRAACPDDYVGHLPWMVEHQPPPRTLAMSDVLRALPATRMEDVVFEAIRRRPFGAGLDRLGAHFAAIARQKTSDLAAMIAEDKRARIAESAAKLEELLATYAGEPEIWAEDVRAAIDAHHTALRSPEVAIPSDVPGGVEACARLLQRYGELLGAWQEIHAAAARLAERGVRMTIPARE